MEDISERHLPLVSIITPSYNQDKFLTDNITSIKNQDYPNIEHLVIDGLSEDDSVKILRRHEDDYNLNWFSEPDDGQSDAINKGFKRANGEIIGWLNSDDAYLTKNTISKVVQSFHNYQADIIYGDVAIIGPDSKLLKFQHLLDFSYGRLANSCFIAQPSVFFKKKVVKNNLLDADLEYTMDYDYWFRLGKEYTFKHCDIFFAVDRNHAGRKILKNKPDLEKEKVKLRKKYDEDQWPHRNSSVPSGLIKHLKRQAFSLHKTYNSYRYISNEELAFDCEIPRLSTLLINHFKRGERLV